MRVQCEFRWTQEFTHSFDPDEFRGMSVDEIEAQLRFEVGGVEGVHDAAEKIWRAANGPGY